MNEKARFEEYAETHQNTGPIADFEKQTFAQCLQKNITFILDLGCGDGRYTRFFRQEHPESLIVPSDISVTRVQRTRNFSSLGVAASANNLPFCSESFDAVFLMQVIEHVPDPNLVISECYRVLKKNGYFILSTPNYPIKRCYDWLEMIRFQKWNRFFDDPTHCSKFNACKLERTLKRCFRIVTVYPTFVLGERIPFILKWRDQRKSSMYFTHKLLAISQK